MATEQKITTFLWFNDNAEEATNFYTSVFKNSKILNINRKPDGKVITTEFLLEGTKFIAMNGGPMYPFTCAISLQVGCTTQEEVDDLWAKLSEGGYELSCGWVADKFGLAWQVTPTILIDLLCDKDPAKAQRAQEAMEGMKKLDIEALKKAHAGV